MFLTRPLKKIHPSRFGSERGMTLTELLVAMTLLVVIAGVSLAILLSTTSSDNRFGQNTANQTEVANAINTINRDIVAANGVTYASDSALTLSSTEDNQDYEVKIFGWSGTGATADLPSNFTVDGKANSIRYPAILEQRKLLSTNAVTQNVLVPGWKSSNQSTPLFTYYDRSDAQVPAPSNGNASIADKKTIARIEFFIAAKVSDRTSNIELAGSAVPRSFNPLGTSDPNFPNVPGAPVLSGTLPEKSTTATLTWTVPAGTTSYTLYRKQNDGAYGVLAIIPDPDTTKYVDPNLTLGDTYTYYIVAIGPGGAGPNSNAVPLTVVPPPTSIVNVNTNRTYIDSTYSGQDGTSNPRTGQSFTVARDLTNQITWAPSHGATGYYVYRDGSTSAIADVSASVLSIRDSAVNYGESHTYQVEPYNQGTNCLVGNPIYRCDGDWSPGVKLISPPTAPTIAAQNAGVTNRDQQPYDRVWLTDRGSSQVINYTDLYSTESGVGSVVDCALRSDTNTDIGPGTGYSNLVNRNASWGSGTCYGARSGNDAGLSPISNGISLYHGPSTFSIVNINSTVGQLDAYANGYKYTTAVYKTEQIAWNASSGATGYRIFSRDNNTNNGYQEVTNQCTTVGQNFCRFNVDFDDSHSYYVQAYTQWGGGVPEQNINSNEATLYSAPGAPQISAVANDDSTGSKSRNDVTVNSRTRNSAAVTIYRTQVAAKIGTGSCDTSSALTTNAGTTTGDGNADWGSDTCYVAYARNDAGTGPASNKVVAEQLPGKFGYTQLANTRHFVGTYVSTLNVANFSDNSAHQGLIYDMAWNNSLGSTRYNVIVGYKRDNPDSSNRIESWAGNGYSICGSAGTQDIVNSQMPSSSVDNATCVVGDTDNSHDASLRDTNLSPGSFYRVVTVSVGNNGLRRGINNDFVTTATVPQYASVYSYKRQVDNASTNGTAYIARVANVGIETSIGTSTTVRAFEDWNDNRDAAGYGVANPTWYSRDSNQGSNSYLRVRTPGGSATHATLVKDSGQCRQVVDNWCHVFNTDYDSSGNSHTTVDMTQKYNSNWNTRTNANPPTHYQFGNYDNLYDNGGAQAQLASSSYGYSGWSDQLQWYSGMSQTNCYYRACNPNDTDVASGPWAGYSNNEFVPNGKTAHDYYYVSPTQDTSPTSGGTKGTPPAAATRQYATSDSAASTSDGSLPDNNVASND